MFRLMIVVIFTIKKSLILNKNGSHNDHDIVFEGDNDDDIISSK